MINKVGFTLIELLVVIIIVAILAAVALPQYQKAVYKARIARILPLMKAIKEAQVVHYLTHGNYTPNPADWDIDLPADITRTFVLPGGKTSSLYFADNSSFSLTTQISEGMPEERILFDSPNIPVYIWLSLPNDKWMCYPRGTKIGVELCKSLGCPDNITTSTQYCKFTY